MLKKIKVEPSNIPLSVLVPYGNTDASATLPLAANLLGECSNHFDRIAWLDTATSWVLAKMEVRGITVDKDKAEQLNVVYTDKIKTLREKFEEAEVENTKSNPQLLKYFKSLFPGYTIKAVNKDARLDLVNEVLERGNEIDIGNLVAIERLEQLKKADIIKDTFLPIFLESNGIIHPDHLVDGTRTGRLSCRKPNSQNQPDEARVLFLARPGYRLCSVDYSQMELRIMAWMSGDIRLIHECVDGDLHTKTANEYQMPRDAAKVINFGIPYRMTEFGLARKLSKKGKRYKPQDVLWRIDKFFEMFPQVAAFNHKTIAECIATGYVSNAFGRLRRLTGLEGNSFKAQAQQRKAVNSPIQGTAGDITKHSMVLLDRYLENNNIDAHLLLTVHDEIVLEYSCSDNIIIDALKLCMGNQYLIKKHLGASITLPLDWEAKVGDNWGEMTKLYNSKEHRV